jgi:hypothetical protein
MNMSTVKREEAQAKALQSVILGRSGNDPLTYHKQGANATASPMRDDRKLFFLIIHLAKPRSKQCSSCSSSNNHTSQLSCSSHRSIRSKAGPT